MKAREKRRRRSRIACLGGGRDWRASPGETGQDQIGLNYRGSHGLKTVYAPLPAD